MISRIPHLGFVVAAGWTLGFRILGMAMQVGVFVLIVRLHDLPTVGLYAVVNGLWMINRLLGAMGLDAATWRYEVELLTDGRTAEARGFEIKTRRIVLAWNLAAAFVLFLVGLAAMQLDLFTVSPVAIAICGLGLPVYAMIGVLNSQLRARKRIQAAQFPESVLPHAVLGILLLAGLPWIEPGLVWLLSAQVMAATTVVLTYLILDRRHRGPVEAPSPAYWREARHTAWRILAGRAVTALADRGPVIMVSSLLGGAAAALYETAQRFGLLGTVTTWAAGVAVTPMFAEANAKGERAKLRSLLIMGSWLAVLPSLAIFAFLAAFGDWALVWLVGADYEAAHGAMVFLAGAAAINAAAGLSTNLLNVTGHERVVLVCSALKLAVVVVGVPLFGFGFGIAGAAAAVTLGALLRDGGAASRLKPALAITPGLWPRTAP